MARSVNSTYGDTVWEFAISLQNTRLRPNIVYAAAMERCPLSLSFVFTAAKVGILYHNSNVMCEETRFYSLRGL